MLGFETIIWRCQQGTWQGGVAVTSKYLKSCFVAPCTVSSLLCWEAFLSSPQGLCTQGVGTCLSLAVHPWVAPITRR